MEYDQQGDKWHVNCSDGHLSDYWTIDQNGAVYWCGDLKSDNYMKIVNECQIDYKYLIEIISNEKIRLQSRVEYVTNEIKIIQAQLYNAPVDVLKSIEEFKLKYTQK